MSDTDSFIEEVSEEVRRDRLYGAFRRYGWIAVAGVFVIVGGAAWNEYNKSQDRAAAEKLGDDMLAALEAEAPADRAEALAALSAATPAAQAVVILQRASELQAAGDTVAAAAALEGLAVNGEVAPIYRQMAAFKSVLLQGTQTPAADRSATLEGLVQSGGPLRLLAEEQLALIAVETGDTDAALTRLERIAADAEASAGLRRRASQLIVALGGDRTGA
ncbi:hypothetical protein [Thalassobius sp. Cn5-15]|uniref:hypothetical protein n=1 Tax=Thalassobius sp. Cn5-15 TaxID=2917763 RepID=UPI001EF1C27B|nr:hypothetical protein [Thalassobius sp. Cn5-15]